VRRPRAARSQVQRSAFAGFRFPPEVITVAVRWYLRGSVASSLPEQVSGLEKRRSHGQCELVERSCEAELR
jgi:transposase-like protein